MSILVTGAGGLVGTALMARLGRSRADAIALTSRKDCDLEDFSATKALFARLKPRFVYHLAAAVYGLGGNSAFPGDQYRRNILINTHVIEAARLSGVEKIVAMGTAAIYSDGAPQPFRERDALLGAPHSSELPYATAKRAMLVQLMAYRLQYGLPYAYAIATNMYGPNDRFDTVHGHVAPSLILKFVEAADGSAPIEIWGDGSPTRDFLHAEDAAMGLALMMEKGEGAYNLASGKSHRVADLVAVLAARLPSARYSWDPTRPMGQLARRYDVSNLETLGFAPRFDLEQGVNMTVDWVLAHRSALRV
jgi:GDP-L-fucose synthase